jgi:mycothiol synthase
MNMIPKPFTGERDLDTMRDLLVSGRQVANGTYYVHVGDLNWWLFYPPLSGGHWDSMYLWDDPEREGELLGWSLLSLPETFDVYVRPDLRGTELANQMYAWAVNKITATAREAGEEMISIQWVVADDEVLDDWLRKHGFVRCKEDVYMNRDLSIPIPDVPLPDGFTVRSCREMDEVEARAKAQYGAFDSTAPFDRYVARFTRFMQSPVYGPDRDVVAAAPNGDIAAFSIVWLDAVNRVGSFEPVGTHPDFQRKGLGKAVMLEALRRLEAQGMQQAIVCTSDDNLPAIRLYESVGFRVVNRLGQYKKRVEL